MSDQLLIALIAASAGIIGGLVGAIASPIGKDWVARRESERADERDRELGDREQSVAAAGARATSIRRTLDEMAKAMEDYNLEWRGLAGRQRGRPEVIRAANAAWVASREIHTGNVRTLVDVWKTAIDVADMQYREGRVPVGMDELQGRYVEAAEGLGALLSQSDG